ncbi:MAG: putative LPS assembly protein LptD, partial [Bacteroidales bacterium]
MYSLASPRLQDDSTKGKSPPVNTLARDSLTKDSISSDSIKQKESKNALNDIVNFEATDSMILMGSNQALLYGNGKVTYENIQLDANYIRMNMDSSLVYATGTKDSIGKLQGLPIFKQGEDQYESQTMRYNFKTQKGFITNVVTQQGEGYVVGGQTKKMPNDDMYMTGCKYTTCDHHDHPHFYLNLTKAKVRPGKNIVTGPAYLVIEDVPLPVAIPFGFFPFSKTYSSGIIFPTFGDDGQKGFYLSNGGYYFALSDYMDLALTGEIYTKGSWGLNAQSTYTKRYKYNGNFNLNYLVTVLGDKGLPD